MWIIEAPLVALPRSACTYIHAYISHWILLSISWLSDHSLWWYCGKEVGGTFWGTCAHEELSSWNSSHSLVCHISLAVGAIRMYSWSLSCLSYRLFRACHAITSHLDTPLKFSVVSGIALRFHSLLWLVFFLLLRSMSSCTTYTRRCGQGAHTLFMAFYFWCLWFCW